MLELCHVHLRINEHIRSLDPVSYTHLLGCEVQALRLLHTKLHIEEIYDTFRRQDMIYLGAGDTTFLMEQLQSRKLDLLLHELADLGIVICGLSAGANVLFEYGYSNIATDRYDIVNGTGLIKGAFCPHYQKQERKAFDTIYLKPGLQRICCKDNQAYVVAVSYTHLCNEGVLFKVFLFHSFCTRIEEG